MDTMELSLCTDRPDQVRLTQWRDQMLLEILSQSFILHQPELGKQVLVSPHLNPRLIMEYVREV